MKVCTNCKKEFPEDALFCDVCGSRLEEDGKEGIGENGKEEAGEEAVENGTVIFCKNCGKKLDAGYEFCPECGEPLNMDSVPSGAGDPVSIEKNKKWSKRVLAACLAAIVIAGGIMVYMAVNRDYTNQLLYLKNEKWYITDGSVEGTNKLSKTSEDGTGFYVIAVQEEENRIVYREDGSLYYRSLKDTGKESVKIASSVIFNMITDDGKKILYIKENGDLYSYDFTDERKIEKGVGGFAANTDGTEFVYIAEDLELFYKVGEKEPVKLCDELSYGYFLNGGTERGAYYVTEDFSCVYFVEDSTLYKAVIGGDKIKIADDIGDKIVVYDSGELYYWTQTTEERALSDYIVDDYAAEDQEMQAPKEPKEPKEPFWGDYGYAKEAAYEKAYKAYEKKYKKYEKELEAYWEANEEYSRIEERNAIREEVSREKVSFEKINYYYYNGVKSEEIGQAESVYGSIADFSDYAYKKAVAAFYMVDDYEIPKLSLSEIYSAESAIEEVRDLLDEKLEENKAVSIAVGAKGERMDEITGRYNIHNDGQRISYIDSNDLMQIEIADNQLKKPVTYDTDVKYYWFTNQANNEIYYIKDYDGEYCCGDLYYNKERLDEDVYCDTSENIKPTYKKGKFYYIVDYDTRDNSGKLVSCKDGKITEIKSDVAGYSIGEDGELYYGTDADDRGYTLYRWDGSQGKEIASDVCMYCALANGDLYYLKDYDEDDETGNLYVYKKSEERLDRNVGYIYDPKAAQDE